MIILIPLAGTSAGALLVFLIKKGIDHRIEKALLGFAAGVMVAASIWSLIIPSIEMSSSYKKASWVPAAVGLWLGIGLLLLIDKLATRLQHKSRLLRRSKAKGLSRTAMMLLAITIHNIPEGMAVGVTCAGALAGNTGITMAGALVLSIGIAIQNLPEGAIVSMPLYTAGVRKSKAFLCGVMSGVVEPIGAGITILLARQITPVLPYLLALAAGAMLHVVIEELIPELHTGNKSRIGTIGAGIGFCTMMILDVTLG